MLDMQRNKHGNLVYNDIFTTVDNTDAWVYAFNEFYGPECVPVKEVNGGMQYLIKKDGKPFITTFYPNTSGCMIQPPNNDEEISLQSLKIMPDIKKIKDPKLQLMESAVVDELNNADMNQTEYYLLDHEPDLEDLENR